VKLQAFSIFDQKTETFSAPFFVPKLAMAQRVITQQLMDPRTDIAQFPEDYHLYRVGEFETDNAVLTPSQPVMECTINSCRPRSHSPVVDAQALSGAGESESKTKEVNQ